MNCILFYEIFLQFQLVISEANRNTASPDLLERNTWFSRQITLFNKLTISSHSAIPQQKQPLPDCDAAWKLLRAWQPPTWVLPDPPRNALPSSWKSQGNAVDTAGLGDNREIQSGDKIGLRLVPKSSDWQGAWVPEDEKVWSRRWSHTQGPREIHRPCVQQSDSCECYFFPRAFW